MLFKLETDGVAHFVYPEADEVNAIIPFSKEIVTYILDQVKAREVHEEEVFITYEEYAHGIICTSDRFGKPV